MKGILKRLLALFLILTLLSADVCAFAEAVSTLTLPSALTIIDEEAFAGDTSIQKVVVPDGTTELRARAFAGSSVSEIVLPSSVSSIADDAFDGVKNLTVDATVGTYAYDWAVEEGYIDEPASYAGFIYEITDGECIITKYTGTDTIVTVPASIEGYPVVYIGTEAFAGSGITKVTLAETVERIATAAFYGCASLEYIYIPPATQWYGRDIFTGCSSALTIYGEDYSSAQSYAEAQGIPFVVDDRGFSPLSDFDYTCEDGICRIWAYLGSDTTVLVPDTIGGYPVTEIGEAAFYNKDFIEEVILPDTITSIGPIAFGYCSSLKSINIPDHVENFGTHVFSDCSSLSSITLPNGLKSINSYLFVNCSNLSSITLPDSIESISEAAFSGCSSLSSIVLPDSIISIADYAFSHCSSLSSIAIPNGVTSIDAWAFSGCSNLHSLAIPNSVTTIGDDAFAGCSSLNNVEIPNSITRISNSAFRACSSLNNIKIPNSVTTIGDSAFENCTGLSSIEIPNSITSIGNMAFYSSGLSSIEIPDGVTSIGSGAFSNCSSLSSVMIPKSVTSIGYSAFHESSNVTVYGYTGSVAETYAKGNSISFVALDAPAATPTPSATLTATPPATPGATPTPGLAKPILVHPALSNDEDSLPAFTDDDMTIVWGNVEGAVKYTVRMDESYDEDWDELISEEETTEENYVIPGRELYEGGLFRVRIKAYDVNGETASSDWYYFRVGAASYIGLDDEEILFDYEGDEDRFNIYTSENWKANVSDRSWISLDITSGFATTYLSVEVTENRGDFPRIGTITFTNDAGGYAVLTITQAGNGSANEGNLTITNPEQGDTLDREDISAEWSYRYDHAYYEAKLYDVTSGRTVYQEQMVTDYTDIPESALTYGHVYQLTVSVYNAQGQKINESSIVFRIEDNGSGGNTDPDDEVIETPEVPDGKTEIVYYGIVNNSKIDKMDISVSWDKVIGADYYAVALRDLTLYPDGTPDDSVQKIINTTTQNLNYQISGSKLEQGHSYRLWIAAHKNGVTDAITGKNILFAIHAPETTPTPTADPQATPTPSADSLKWNAVLNGESTIDISVCAGAPDASKSYLFIAEDSQGRHYSAAIPAGVSSKSFAVVKDLKMPRAAKYDLYIMPDGVQLTDVNRKDYFITDIVVPLFSGNMISAVRSGSSDVTSTKKLHIGDIVEIDWDGSYGVNTTEVVVSINGATLIIDPIKDKDGPETVRIDTSELVVNAGDVLEVTVAVDAPDNATAAMLEAAGYRSWVTKSWEGTFVNHAYDTLKSTVLTWESMDDFMHRSIERNVYSCFCGEENIEDTCRGIRMHEMVDGKCISCSQELGYGWINCDLTLLSKDVNKEIFDYTNITSVFYLNASRYAYMGNLLGIFALAIPGNNAGSAGHAAVLLKDGSGRSVIFSCQGGINGEAEFMMRYLDERDTQRFLYGGGCLQNCSMNNIYMVRYYRNGNDEPIYVCCGDFGDTVTEENVIAYWKSEITECLNLKYDNYEVTNFNAATNFRLTDDSCVYDRAAEFYCTNEEGVRMYSHMIDLFTGTLSYDYLDKNCDYYALAIIGAGYDDLSFDGVRWKTLADRYLLPNNAYSEVRLWADNLIE